MALCLELAFVEKYLPSRGCCGGSGYKNSVHMKVLVLNCGSSSIKYQLHDMGGSGLMCKGIVERVGKEDAIFEYVVPAGSSRVKFETPIADHAAGIHLILDHLVNREIGVIKDFSELGAAGHRVAHGGSYFSESVLITPDVEAKIESCAELAPLHNPAHLVGIRTIREILPNLPQVAAFDTAFHQTIPEVAYTYALPYDLAEKHRIRKYGFHGTSHKFVAQQLGKQLNRPWDSLRIISCHLGNGASVTAINCGKSVDTSMGFTPVDGLVMGTRTGDIDPSALLFLAAPEKENFTIDELNSLVNKRSGLLGISGHSSDMRDLAAAAKSGNRQAALAREVFCYRIRKYIGAYYALLEGLDAIIFTGGIGENDAAIRHTIANRLTYLGADYDAEANGRASGLACISKPDSRVALWVIPTDEELVIALDTQHIVSKA